MNHMQLLNDIVTFFDAFDLQKLCLVLDVSYDELPGRDREEKARALIQELDRRHRLDDLTRHMIGARPELATAYGPVPRAQQARHAGNGPAPRFVDEQPTMHWSSKQHKPQLSEPSPVLPSALRPLSEIPTLAWPSPKPENGSDTLASTTAAYPGQNSMELYSPEISVRESDVRKAADILVSGCSCSITGMSGCGKSTIMQGIKYDDALSNDRKELFATIDLSLSDLLTPAQVHNSALAQWYAYLIEAPPPEAPTLSDFARQLRALHDASYRPVLMLDSFDAISQKGAAFDAQLLDFWHSLIALGQLRFVTASVFPLSQMLAARELGSQFASGLQRVHLRPLTVDQARRLSSAYAKLGNFLLTAEAQADLLLWCGTTPKAIELGSAALADCTKLDNYQPGAGIDLLNDAAESYWFQVWRSLTTQQRRALSMPLDWAGPLVATRQYRSLIDLGILIENGSGLQLYCRGFEDWVSGFEAPSK